MSLLALLYALPSFADGGCGELNIIIQNYTGVACTLQKSHVSSGYLSSEIPQSIPPNHSSDTITLEQGYFSGISSMLAYRCGSETIEIRSNQNYCFLQAGQVSGQVYTADSIHVRYIAKNGSWWSSNPGRMTWSLF